MINEVRWSVTVWKQLNLQSFPSCLTSCSCGIKTKFFRARYCAVSARWWLGGDATQMWITYMWRSRSLDLSRVPVLSRGLAQWCQGSWLLQVRLVLVCLRHFHWTYNQFSWSFSYCQFWNCVTDKIVRLMVAFWWKSGCSINNELSEVIFFLLNKVWTN